MFLLLPWLSARQILKLESFMNYGKPIFIKIQWMRSPTEYMIRQVTQQKVIFFMKIKYPTKYQNRYELL